MTSRLTIILIFTTLISCSYSDKDFYLNEEEKSFLSPFIKGDTIYYESTYKDIDTILVLGIDSTQKKQAGNFMASPAFNNVHVSIKHLPVDTFYSSVFFDSSTDKSDTGYNTIIGITKLPQDKTVEYVFIFKRFMGHELGELHDTSLSINSCQVKNYYIIKNDWLQNQTAPNDIECLYWTKKEGLVAYKYNNGIFWTSKSCR